MRHTNSSGILRYKVCHHFLKQLFPILLPKSRGSEAGIPCYTVKSRYWERVDQRWKMRCTNSTGILKKTDHLIWARLPDLIIVNEKKRVIIKIIIMHKAFQPRDDRDRINVSGKEGKKKTIHQHWGLRRCNNSGTGGAYKKAASNSSRNNLRTNRKTSIKNLENENGKKNNCMDNSSDILRKLHAAWFRSRLKRGNLKRETKSLNNCTK